MRASTLRPSSCRRNPLRTGHGFTLSCDAPTRHGCWAMGMPKNLVVQAIQMHNGHIGDLRYFEGRAMGRTLSRRNSLLSRRLIAPAIACLMLVWLVPRAYAVESEGGLSGFHRTLWRTNEGSPVDVRAIAQTHDGFLWLGGYTGLYRFDGIRFERFEPPWGQGLPSNAITTITAEPNGLWVAASGGHIVRLVGTRIAEQYKLPEGTGHVFRILIKGSERFAVTSGGLFRGNRNGWRLEQIGNGPLPLRLYDALLLPDGSLWLSSTDGFYLRSAGEKSFVKLGAAAAGIGKFSLAANGDVWYCGETGGLHRFPRGSRSSDSNPDFRCHLFFLDAQGMAWVDGPQGAGRVEPGRALAARSIDIDGLLSDQTFGEAAVARTIIEDQEGSVWIGTSNGLSQFHAYRLGQPESPGGYGGLAPAKGGGLWLISHTRGLIKIGNQAGSRPAAGLRLTHITRDSKGIVWVGGQRRAELLRIDGEKISSVPFGPGGEEVWVSGIAVAGDGSLWVSTQPSPRGHLYRLVAGQWIAGGGIHGLPDHSAPGIWSDSIGRIWLGYPDSRLSMVNGSALKNFPEVAKLKLGTIRKFGEFQGHLLVAGDDGMAMLVGDKFRLLRLQQPMRILAPTSVLTDRNGDVWINQANNLLRIPAAQMHRALDDANALLGAEIFDYREGRAGAPISGAPHPTIAQTDEGIIWIASANLTTFDPSTPQTRSRPPHVQITNVEADGVIVPQSESDGIQIPAGTDEFTIRYTATSLTAPERILLRFQLEGVDRQWRPGGHDREVTYKRPAPGNYSFRVSSSDGIGLWNPAGAEVTVRVVPRYYETTWFKAMAIGFVGALCVLLLWARSTWLTSRIKERLQERSRERERIARELHDTLLQGIQGLMLHVQSVANDLPEGNDNKVLMGRALDRADRLMAEGRQRVSDLRMQEEGASLGASLHQYFLENDALPMASIHVREVGAPREIATPVRTEVLKIGVEAVANAIRHSQGRKVRIVIRYDRNALRLRVSDDGCGIDASFAAAGRPGHWGIRGMHERARAIKARFRIGVAKSGGTVADLVVPAVIAYRDRVTRWRRALRRTWIGRSIELGDIR